MWDHRRPRRRTRLAAGALLLLIALAWIATDPWRGPHLLHVYDSHGVDVGDFVALAIAAVGVAVAWRG